jgi:LPS-assembly protein
MFLRILKLVCVAALAVVLSVSAGSSEPQATLIADNLSIRGTSVLLAEGNVEIFFKGRRLKASAIRYDQSLNSLQISGPIYMDTGDGNYILAEQADLNADLTEGVLRSARLVLAGQLQLAASEVMRVNERYTSLNRVSASSCKICAGSSTPLWEVRARRVVHDQIEHQLYFDQAQMRFGGIPIFYIPRLRMPDPTLKRATGFLMPRFSSNTLLGTGVRMPYFIKFGDHKDLTIVPFLSSGSGKSVELRYRQAFATGTIELLGSASRDDIVLGQTRGYVQATGEFALPRNFTLTFRAEDVTDPSYLLDYGYPEKDRLDSRIEVKRTRRNELIVLRLIGFKSLRPNEDNATLPFLVADATLTRRFGLGGLGGEGGLSFQLHSHTRRSHSFVDGPDPDLIADGRDVSRALVRADWRKNWQLPSGLGLSVLGEATADLTAIREDATYLSTGTRLHGAVAAELRWPWVKANGVSGVSQMIEPVAQLVLAPGGVEHLPNEDSLLAEFDEGNLFALNRFPGNDAIERGLRANLGLNYTRIDPDGWTVAASFGRVLRAADLGQFSVASGLSGQTSDWLTAVRVSNDDGFSVLGRALFDSNLSMNKAEVRLAWIDETTQLSTGFVKSPADLAEDRLIAISELAFDGQIKIASNWTARLATRYDFNTQSTAKAAAGLGFRNECLSVDLSLSRRFTSSTSVKPATDFGLSVEFLGFGSSTSSGAARQCRR